MLPAHLVGMLGADVSQMELLRKPAHVVQGLVGAIIEAAGCESAEAQSVADRLVGANLRGHDSHGVIRTPRYVEWIDTGRVVPGQRVTVEKENEVIAILDGGYGFGQSLGEQTVDIGVAKAKRNGVAVTALKHAGHLGRIGDWAERAAEHHCASLHMVNVRGSLLVAPFGARERRGGTSPFCAGIPVANDLPIVLDFATSLVAEGKALVAARGGKPLPEGALISHGGKLTNDPVALYGETPPGRSPDARLGCGALAGFGSHKGSGLNFFMEMFAGALTGSGTNGALGETERRRFCNGMLSVFMDVGFFHSDEWFATEVRNYVEFWKSAALADGHDEVLIPGEVERSTMAERKANGLPLPRATWDDILATAGHVGLSDRAIESLLAH